MNRSALVLGATGGIGSETARALLDAGYRVRALCRRPEAARTAYPELAAVEWVRGDAMNAADVVAAANGMSVVVHALNPPGYRNWGGLVLPMLENSITAAKAAGARLVLPGTVYNFGPNRPALVDESVEQKPITRKGKIRVALEERLRRAASEGVPVLVVRAGDFFGPRAQNSWFAQGFVKRGRPLRSVVYPGRPEASHAWAYLPDLARTIVLLLERDAELGVRYLWQTSLLLDNRKLVAFLGEEPHTPLAEALEVTLDGLGCMRPAAGAERGARDGNTAAALGA